MAQFLQYKNQIIDQLQAKQKHFEFLVVQKNCLLSNNSTKSRGGCY